MNLQTLSASVFAVGLGGLAALLFVLQRLRVRHRELEVVTTLFWREAVEETRSRVLMQRFRHPWAYLLVVAIAGLWWLAVAQPRWQDRTARDYALVLDGSAGMAWGTRFDAAVAALRERAAALPRDATRIVLAAGRVDTLLAPGEDLALFDRRVLAKRPEAAPASVERAVFDLAGATRPAAGLTIEVFGDAPIDAAVPGLLGGDVELLRAVLPPGPRDGNAGVVALGVTEAAAGAWNRVDLLVEIGGDRASRIGSDCIRLDGVALAGVTAEAVSGGVRFVARAVPAAGGRIDVTLPGGDAFPLDDRASLVLPDRRPVRVATSPVVPPPLRAMLALDQAVALVDDNPDVVVRGVGEAFFTAVPALELATAETGAAFVVRRTAVDDPERDLRADFELLGIGEIDSMELAQRAGKPIELELATGDAKGIAVWASLFGDGYDFRQSRACPLFLARALRWLADAAPVPFQVAAGDFARDGAQRWVVDGRTLDSAGASLRIPRAGTASGGRGEVVHASLLAASATGALPADAIPAATAGAAGGSEAWTWAVLVVLLLLAGEWFLVRTERMP